MVGQSMKIIATKMSKTTNVMDVYREILSAAEGYYTLAGVRGDKKLARKTKAGRDLAAALGRELYHFAAQLEKTEEINPSEEAKSTYEIVRRAARNVGIEKVREIVYGTPEVEAVSISNFINSRMFARDLRAKLS